MKDRMLLHKTTGFKGVMSESTQRQSDLNKGKVMIETEKGIHFTAPTEQFTFVKEV